MLALLSILSHLIFTCRLTLLFLLHSRRLSVKFHYGAFPAEQASLLPFSFEHLLSLLYDLFEVDEWLRPLEEILQRVSQLSDVRLVLATLLDVEGHLLELLEVLQPGQVVITLDQAKAANLLQVAEAQVVLVKVEVLAVAFLAREHLIRLVKHPLHPLREECLAVEILVLCKLTTRVVPGVVFLNIFWLTSLITYVDLVEFAVEVVPHTRCLCPLPFTISH